MTWREPAWLLALLAVPLLLAGWLWLERWRERAARRFARPERLAGVRAGRLPGWLAVLRVGLWLAAFAALLLGLAGPRWGRQTLRLRSHGVDVALVVDVSASMRARDVAPSRFERMMAELRAALPRLAGHRVGAVAFAADTLEFPLTTDLHALELFLRELRPEEVPVQGTDLGAALEAAARALRRAAGRGAASAAEQGLPVLRAGRSRVVLALTDGEDHEGHLRQAARALRDVGAEVHVAVFAGRSPVQVPILGPGGRLRGWVRDAQGRPARSAFTPEAEARLRRALQPVGLRLHAVGEGAPLAPFLERLGQLRHGALRSRTVTRWGERFPWPLSLALLLLLLEAWLPRALRPGEARA